MSLELEEELIEVEQDETEANSWVEPFFLEKLSPSSLSVLALEHWLFSFCTFLPL